MERRLGDRGGGCCEVGGDGGGGGVVSGVCVVCGDGVDRGVGDVDCGVVKAPISAMIIRVPEKDRWCGTRGKFVRWKGVRITKASKRAKVIVREQEKRFKGYRCEMKGERLLRYPYTTADQEKP
ncbi:hypothetical protein Tco_1098467 [Tanacetum coccineum]